MKHLKISALSLLILLGFVWGTGYSIARYATLNGVPPFGYSFWQSIGPAILLGAFCLPRLKNLKWDFIHLRYYFICGLTGIAIPNSNMYFAAPHLPAGILAVVVNTVPIMAYPLALFAGVESFHRQRFFGVILAVVGLMLLVVPHSNLNGTNILPWIMSSLLTPVCFAICAVYISRFRPNDSDSLSLAAGTLLASSILLAPLVILSGSFYLPHFPFSSADKVIFLEIILSSIGYVLFFQLIKIAGPVYYSLVDTIVSLTGLFWGYLIFHEKLNFWSTTAVVLILIALTLVTQRQREQRYEFSS